MMHMTTTYINKTTLSAERAAPWLFLVILTVLAAVHQDALFVDPSSGAVVEVSTVRRAVLGCVYIVALVTFIYRWAEFSSLVIRAWPWWIFILWVAATTIWIPSVAKTITNLGHYIGMSIVAMLCSYSLRMRPAYTLKVLCVGLLILVVASIGLALLAPSVGILVQAIQGARWRGITSHPNALGVVSLLAVWTATALYLVQPIRTRDRVIVATSIVSAIICLLGANSVTSLLISLWTMLLLPILYLACAVRGVRRLLSLGILLLFLSCSVLALFVVYPDFFSTDKLFAVLGRERTLTGRTEIWAMGVRLFLERPITGWGFDSLNYLRAESRVALPTQFHSGYIHMLVMGGMISVIVAVTMLFGSIKSSLLMFRENLRLWVALITLLLAICIHNVTEASFLRETSPLWLMFLLIYFTYLSRTTTIVQERTVMNRPSRNAARYQNMIT